MIHEYAIKFASGLYYTGDGSLYGEAYHAYTYTEAAAYKRIASSIFFKGCTVEEIL